MSALVFPSLAGLLPTVTRTQEYSTGIQEASAGVEYRSNWRTRARVRWALGYEFLRSDATNAEWQRLVGFFARHAGSYDSFLYTDPQDSAVAAQHFGLGDGVTTVFQLQRTIVAFALWSAPVAFWPAITDGFEPVTELNGAPSLFVDGVAQVVDVDYTLSPLGVVTFTSAPGNALPLTWTGSYYWRARFAQDVLATQRIVAGIWEASRVELLQVF